MGSHRVKICCRWDRGVLGRRWGYGSGRWGRGSGGWGCGSGCRRWGDDRRWWFRASTIGNWKGSVGEPVGRCGCLNGWCWNKGEARRR
ncbi:hypothetical protein HanRHA438_Chr08g0366441 [Helianthus annuus]|nr:hypothetical protein HanRHA438_Chr08g0366441 [Helianthus annuus]